MRDRQKGEIVLRLNLVTVWAGCLIACSGCLRPAIDIPPPPESDVVRISQQVLRDYAAGLASSFDAAADQLEAGTLTAAAETNAQLQSANATARKQAFLPLDEHLNETLGGERWDAEIAVQLFRQIANGLKTDSAKKRESLEALAPSP